MVINLNTNSMYIMRSDWRGGFSMSVDAWKPRQENANLVQLELAEGYFSDLRGTITIRKDDMKILELKEHTKIAISISGNEWVLDMGEPSPPVFLSATVTSISVKQGRNLWVNFADGAKYIDYLDIAISFREFSAIGNLLVVKEHAKGMELGIGNTLFLKIQRVIYSS
jgi:hypothetical protein